MPATPNGSTQADPNPVSDAVSSGSHAAQPAGRSVALGSLPTGAATATMRLDQLPPRHCGFIADIEADDDDTNRLKAMGVCVGRRVEAVQRGDPLILRVLGSRIGLSARLARRVTVEGCAAPECDLRH